MKHNQSIHITIKEPPLTVRSIGVFDSDELIPDIVRKFLTEYTPSDEFKQNTREEVMQLLALSNVLTVSATDDIYTVTLRKTK